MQSIQLIRTAVGMLLMALVLSGCASSLSGGAYSRSQARGAQDVQLGTVQAAREVLIEGTKSGVGTISGGALGGIAGSSIGGGSRARAAAAIGGALLGGLLGAATEEGITRQRGVEVTVRLDSGRTLAVTQGADEVFSPGERVRVLTAYDGTTRVAH